MAAGSWPGAAMAVRLARGGWVVRLEVDEPDTADSPQDVEDIWLPVLAKLQLLVNSP